MQLPLIIQSLLPNKQKRLNNIDTRSSWFGSIRESYTGAWQQNVEVKNENVLTYHALFRCVSLIKSDVAKLPVLLMQEDSNGIKSPSSDRRWSGLLKKPNQWQNRIQFYENWLNSKLLHGNTYVLKRRDRNQNIVGMYVLDPSCVEVLVSDSGEVFYELSRDNLSGQNEDQIRVPASEIIHDRMNCLFHPLVGVSPIYACGVAAVQGLQIQTKSTKFFENGSRPSGVLTAPGTIADETAQRLKDHWDNSYTGANAGKVAVLGDGLEYKAMHVSAADAQLIEQLKMSAETVCSAYGVPAYKAGVGEMPSYDNIDALGQQYYTDCLQIHIESIEIALDEGLGIEDPYSTQFNLQHLFRMDTPSLAESEKVLVGAGIKAPNESRKVFSLPPMPGGDSPYMQEQNYSLEDLSQRRLEQSPVDDFDEGKALAYITKELLQ